MRVFKVDIYIYILYNIKWNDYIHHLINKNLEFATLEGTRVLAYSCFPSCISIAFNFQS